MWADKRIALHIVSFNAGLTRGHALDQLKPFGGRDHRWTTILVTDGKDLTSTAIIDRILRSPLHEIQVYPAGLSEQAVNARVLNAVKDLIDLRGARMQNLPRIVCRVCTTGRATVELTQWARQVRLDRLDITERQTEQKRLWP